MSLATALARRRTHRAVPYLLPSPSCIHVRYSLVHLFAQVGTLALTIKHVPHATIQFFPSKSLFLAPCLAQTPQMYADCLYLGNSLRYRIILNSPPLANRPYGLRQELETWGLYKETNLHRSHLSKVSRTICSLHQEDLLPVKHRFVSATKGTLAKHRNLNRVA